MNVYLPNLRLPSAYQEVEYIQSSNTQYINTGILNQWTSLNLNMKFIITQTNSGGEDGIFGAKGSQTTASPTVFLYNGSPKYLMTWFGRGTGVQITTSALSLNTQHSLDITFTTTNRTWILDGTSGSSSLSVSGGANNTNGYMTLFADGSTPESKSYMKLYSAKITVNGTLVRHFVPCYRKSDSVIGLYDLVNNQFYTNQGTGTFTKGSNVTAKGIYVGTTPVKEVYVGTTKVRPSGWTPGSNTVLYLPMKTDLIDHGPNNISVTNNSVTISDGVGVFGNNKYLGITNFNTYLTNTPFTVCLRLNVSSFSNNDAGVVVGSQEISGTWQGWNIVTKNTNKIRLEARQGSSYTSSTDSLNTNTWYFLVAIFNTSSQSIYLNGNSVATATSAKPNFISRLDIGYNRGNQYVSSYFQGKMSELIIENKVWTAQEILNYYNNTKSNYGL